MVTSGGLQTLLQARITMSGLLRALFSQGLAARSQQRICAPQPRGGDCHRGCTPKQRALDARAEPIPLGQLCHGDTRVCPYPAAPLHRNQGRQRPQGAKGCLCCSSHCPAPRAADLSAGPCTAAAANRTLRPLGTNNPWGCCGWPYTTPCAHRSKVGECQGSAAVRAGSGRTAEVGP